jgi:pimeloyl-ACP methyl ester carboxylesterase
MSTITTRERAEIDAANASGKQPVVFIHGLWLLASSWVNWREYAESKGYSTIAVDWPNDPPTVEAARADPSVFAGNGVTDVADHIAEVIGALTTAPIVIGHSFGGLLAQNIAGRGLAKATVSIDPAPTRGVLPLPVSALKASSPVLTNPANLRRAVTLTPTQFRFAFANAVDDAEATSLYETYHVAAPGRPLFQAATANVNPRSQASADATNPGRGPLLFISGEKDNTVPWALTNAAYKRQKKNGGITEIVELRGRGHSLVIDSGWKEVADTAFAFVERVI